MKPYYEHAGITIYHGDCREVLPQLPKGWCSTCSCALTDEQILAIHLAGGHEVGPTSDLILTDPPYGLAMSGGTWGKQFDATYKNWDGEAFPEIGILHKFANNIIVWGGNYFNLGPSRGWLIWRKPFLTTLADAELAWTNADRNIRVFESCRAPDGPREHPTQKPLELMSWCLSFYPASARILDPFCGSGTTLKAAKDLGKSAIGIEIEEKYCEIAAKRLSQEVFQFEEKTQ